MIRDKSSTKRGAISEREASWRLAQKVGRLRVRITDDHLIAANMPAGTVCHVRFNDVALPGELAAVRYSDGSVDVVYMGEGNTRRFCIISADGQHRQVTSRECRIVGRVNFAHVPAPVLKTNVPHQPAAC